MTIEDVITPEELEKCLLEETVDSIKDVAMLLPDKYFNLITKHVVNHQQGVGMYRALTYVMIVLSKKVII